jgi:hypothetical protein
VAALLKPETLSPEDQRLTAAGAQSYSPVAASQTFTVPSQLAEARR